MHWTKPDFEEISLNMEVTGYVNTDDSVQPVKDLKRTEPGAADAESKKPRA